MAIGDNAIANAAGSIAQGRSSVAGATAIDGIAMGTFSSTQAVAAIAVGQLAAASGASSIAVGAASVATAENAAAFGQQSSAEATDSLALGSNTRVASAHLNSSAIGAGAKTVLDNQMMFGTTAQSYTMPGITSDLSRGRQSGLLQLATTDASGNLATDGGDVFKAIATLQAGVAVAMAVETPELATGDNFGIRVGWGGFDALENTANAVGASAIGVVARNLFSEGDRLAIDGAVGWGWSEFMDYSEAGVVAGRGGAQFTW
jgi:hypothetical protein